MSTRALLRLYGDNLHAADQLEPEPTPLLCTVYNHWDGYPTHFGRQLVSLLQSLSTTEDDTPGTLAIHLLAALVRERTGVSLVPPDTHGCGEEWVYEVYSFRRHGTRQQRLRVYVGPIGMFGCGETPIRPDTLVYDGPLEEFDAQQVERRGLRVRLQWANRSLTADWREVSGTIRTDR